MANRNITRRPCQRAPARSRWWPNPTKAGPSSSKVTPNSPAATAAPTATRRLPFWTFTIPTAPNGSRRTAKPFRATRRWGSSTNCQKNLLRTRAKASRSWLKAARRRLARDCKKSSRRNFRKRNGSPTMRLIPASISARRHRRSGSRCVRFTISTRQKSSCRWIAIFWAARTTRTITSAVLWQAASWARG